MISRSLLTLSQCDRQLVLEGMEGWVDDDDLLVGWWGL